MINIAVLTSSRADFGIYMPLLKRIQNDKDFNMDIIAFGTHLSRYHGYTLDEIESQGFEVKYKISSMLLNDESVSIATAYALTASKFADFWDYHNDSYHFVLCLGDRYEMAAAVASGIPFNIPFVHIHGGETTLGAIDNTYRHSISLASKIHFVSTGVFAQRVKDIVGGNPHCFVIGSLSLDNLSALSLLSVKLFNDKWGIDLCYPSILITIHPETIAYKKNEEFATESFKALKHLADEYQLIITMPNADTSGTLFRIKFEELKRHKSNRVHLIENFGTESYFSCMQHVNLMIGNTSSGIIEAASFQKYVINIGNRQKGRPTSENVIHVPFESSIIIEKAKEFAKKTYQGNNIYYKKNPAASIISHLKKNQIK